MCKGLLWDLNKAGPANTLPLTLPLAGPRESLRLWGGKQDGWVSISLLSLNFLSPSISISSIIWTFGIKYHTLSHSFFKSVKLKSYIYNETRVCTGDLFYDICGGSVPLSLCKYLLYLTNKMLFALSPMYCNRITMTVFFSLSLTWCIIFHLYIDIFSLPSFEIM